MKITTFNPQIITRDAESVIGLFEELGFQRRHTKQAVGDLRVTGVTMEDGGGFRVDVSQSDALPVQSVTAIRINVDDFDEAYRLLTARGFQNFYKDHTADTPSSRSAVLLQPGGLVINLVQHIKKS